MGEETRDSHLPSRGFWDGKSSGQKKRIQSHFQEVQFSSNLQHYLGPFWSSGNQDFTIVTFSLLFQDVFRLRILSPLCYCPLLGSPVICSVSRQRPGPPPPWSASLFLFLLASPLMSSPGDSPSFLIPLLKTQHSRSRRPSQPILAREGPPQV